MRGWKQKGGRQKWVKSGVGLREELPQTEVNLFAILGPTEGKGPFPTLNSWTPLGPPKRKVLKTPRCFTDDWEYERLKVCKV